MNGKLQALVAVAIVGGTVGGSFMQRSSGAPRPDVAPEARSSVNVPPAPAVSEHTYAYKVVDGVPIQADVIRPGDDSTRPVIVWIHGGALISGDRESVRAVGLPLYLHAGYAVVSIDYRLAPETKAAGIIDDLRDAITWVRQEGPALFHIDPGRLAVVGHSAGGYLTLMAGFCVEPRPQALVPFYGYGDVAGAWYSEPDSFYNTRPAVSRDSAYSIVGRAVVTSSRQTSKNRGQFYLYCRQQGIWPEEVVGHDPAREPAAFNPFCPLRNVTPAYPPTLLIHGDRDQDVPYEQSVLMARELARHGVPHDLITVPGGGHGLGIPQYFREAATRPPDDPVRKIYDRVLAFLETYLR